MLYALRAVIALRASIALRAVIALRASLMTTDDSEAHMTINVSVVK
jgi:hypothetical protein